jgi:hypothetical protein
MSSFHKTVPPAPLHVASALLIALADWLVFGLNMATGMDAFWTINVGSALTAGGLVALVQRLYARDGARDALLKGAAVAIVVGLPLPLAGSAVALAALSWAWMSSLSARAERP